MRFKALWAGVLAGLATLVASGAAAQHAAHEHGVSRLDLALEGGTLAIEMRLPGADLTGFEHVARTPEETEAVARTLAILRDPASVFTLPADARCALKQVEAETEQEAGGHSEFHVRYGFTCTAPDRLSHLEVRLFDRFAGMHEIEARYLTPRGQGAAELTPAARRLTF